MRMFSPHSGWQPIDTAPIDTDVMLIVTDGGKAVQAHGIRLGQLWQGNAARRDAPALEAIPASPKEMLAAAFGLQPSR
jgi:hypothetical protein